MLKIKVILLIFFIFFFQLNSYAVVINTNNLFIEKINELKDAVSETKDIKNNKKDIKNQELKKVQKEYKRCFPCFWKKKKLTDRDKLKARGAIIRKEYKERGKIITRSEAFKLAQLENKQPITTEEYLVLSKDVPSHQKKVIKDENREKTKIEEKIINLPNPRYEFEKYNEAFGKVEVDLVKLKIDKYVRSKPLISSDYKRIVYSKVYYYDTLDQSASEIFYIDLDTGLSAKESVLKAIEKDAKSIYKSNMQNVITQLLFTLTPIDFNYDNSKVLFKEKIAHEKQGLWQTNLFVYDFNNNKVTKLTACREAIKYFWLTYKNLELDDYRYDIFPLGWDSNDDSRIIVFAYLYSKDKTAPFFLGIWSVDCENKLTRLVSLSPSEQSIKLNGYTLKKRLYY